MFFFTLKWIPKNECPSSLFVFLCCWDVKLWNVKIVTCKANNVNSFYYWYKYVNMVEVDGIWFFRLKIPLILFILHFIQLYQLWLIHIILLKKCIEMLFPWRTELWDPSVFEINSPCLYNFEIQNKYRIIPCKWKMWGFMIFSDKSSQVIREVCQEFVERYVTCIITVICHQFLKSMFITHCVRRHVFSGFWILFLLYYNLYSMAGII